jgi:hypothetical protein
LDCAAARRANPGPDLEFILKSQRALEIAAGRDAGPAALDVIRVDVHAGAAPQRVLGLLHVLEEHREVDHARGIGLGKLDAAPIDSGLPSTRHWIP